MIMIREAFAVNGELREGFFGELGFEQVEVGDHGGAVFQANAEEDAGGEHCLSCAELGGLLEDDAVIPPK